MIDDHAKDCLHEELREARQALVRKLDGLSEYGMRRPLTVTGTNLLGLVKHTATWEARYLGEVFGRPFPEPLARWQDADGTDLWVTARETRAQIVNFARRAWQHAGQADILREQLDGRTGVAAGQSTPIDVAARSTRWDEIEQAARDATRLDP